MKSGVGRACTTERALVASGRHCFVNPTTAAVVCSILFHRVPSPHPPQLTHTQPSRLGCCRTTWPPPRPPTNFQPISCSCVSPPHLAVASPALAFVCLRSAWPPTTRRRRNTRPSPHLPASRPPANSLLLAHLPPACATLIPPRFVCLLVSVPTIARRPPCSGGRLLSFLL